MLKLTVDPAVLAALQAAFPRPANSAVRALQKYISTLHRLLTEAQQLGKDRYGTHFHLFSISLHDLANQGGQIGPKRIRTHAWLEQHDMALVQTVELGSNLTGVKSRVRLTERVELNDDHSLSEVRARYGADLHAFLDEPGISESAWICRLYPGLENLDQAQVRAQYHITEVDINSLARFIIWLADQACHFPKRLKDTMFRQAVLIYRVAQFSGGLFLQKPKPSHFGRTYYEGVSVQNIHRSLRQAMLGTCWEYDLASAVIAWKLGFAERFRQITHQSDPIEKLFPMTVIYVEDKDDLIRSIRADTYTQESTADVDTQRKQVKTALTALSFGARMTVKGWSDELGQWQVPALGTIFRDDLERQRFIKCPVTEAFSKEQRILDAFIFGDQLGLQPTLRTDPLLQSASGRPSKAKVLAYLYQHAESQVMDMVRRLLAQHNQVVLANIHDAIIVRKRLPLSLRETIADTIRQQTANPYWRLTQHAIRRFEPSAT